MKNNIDNLFKTNASEGKFNYQPGYWESAEKMLAANASKGGLSGGLLSTIALVIVGASLALSFISTSAEQAEGELLLNSNIEESIGSATDSETLLNDQNPSVKINSENADILSNEERTTVDENEKTIAISDAKHELNGQQKSYYSTQSANKETGNAAFNMAQTDVMAKSNGQASLINQAVAVHSNSTNNAAAVYEENKAKYVKNAAFPFQEIQIQQVSETSSDQLLRANGEGEEMTSSNPILAPFKWQDNFTLNIGVDFSYFLLDRSLSSSNTPYQQFRNKNENANGLTNFGLNVQLGYKNWLFNTGVYSTTIREEVNYPSTLTYNTGVDNGYWNQIENWTYTVDSSNWVIDSIYQGHWGMDTAWAVAYDSNYVEQWDTVLTSKEDPEIAKNNGTHSLSYIEVPIWFGRSFGMNRFALDVQGGFAVGFLTGTKGSRYINSSLSGLVSQPSELDQFNNVIFHAMLRTGVRFSLNPELELGVYPSIRYTLNSVMKSSAIKQKYLGYGLSFGLSYKL